MTNWKDLGKCTIRMENCAMKVSSIVYYTESKITIIIKGISKAINHRAWARNGGQAEISITKVNQKN